MADSILFLDGTGNVETRVPTKAIPLADGTALEVQLYGSSEPSDLDDTDKTEGRAEPSAEEKANKLAAMEAQQDRTLRRQKGDMSLYLFYFRSTKTWMILTWVLLLLLTTITGELPRKCS